jgi:hypothetical protein
MCGITCWKGDENLFIKKHFSKYWAVSSIFDLLLKQKSLSLLTDYDFFSSNMANGVSKNPSIHSDFKNLHWIIVKRAPKILAIKFILLIENFSKSKKIRFLDKSFLCVHFLPSNAQFWNHYEKTDFLKTPYDHIQRKKLSSYGRVNALFTISKKATTQYFGKRYSIDKSWIFSSPFLWRTSGHSQNHRFLLTTEYIRAFYSTKSVQNLNSDFPQTTLDKRSDIAYSLISY